MCAGGAKKKKDAPTFVEKSDILRYAILLRDGGVYADTDFECLRSLDLLHDRLNCALYVGLSNTGTVELNIGILGGVPGHELFK